MIVLEHGQVTRFDNVGRYTSYRRLVPALWFSNGKKKGIGNRKCGNRYLAWAWIEAANFAIRFEPAIQRWYNATPPGNHAWSRSRQWRTSWRAPGSICCATAAGSRSIAPFPDDTRP